MKPIALRLDRLETRLTPAVATWDGGGADNHWTTAGNWVGDVAPHPGDDLVFPAGAARLTNVNDFPSGTAFGRLTAVGGYQLTGNGVNVSSGVSVDAAAGTTTSLFVPIGGAGGLTKAGAGTLTLGTTNTYAGLTSIAAGVLVSGGADGLGATGPGNGTTVADGATLTFLGPGALTVLVNTHEAVTVSGDGVPLPGGASAGALRVENGQVILSGPITLAGNARFATAPNSRVNIDSNIGEAGGSRTLTVAADAQFSTGTTTVTGGVVIAGPVQFFSQAPGVRFVLDGGTLTGSGTTGPVAGTSGTLQSGTDLAYGMSVGGLDLGRGATTAATYSVKFIRDTAFSFVIVTGLVSLGDANLSVVAPPPNFAIAPFNRFTIINNDGADPVVGTFSGLPENAVVATAGDVKLRITYRGGDGNDVQLVPGTREPGRIAVGAGAGGVPQVNYFDASGTLLRSFLAYDASFRGGVRVATADFNGDGVADIVTAPGPGGGPHIKVFDGDTGQLLLQFMAYDPSFRGGVFVAAGDTNDDRHPDIVTGAGAGGGPHVKVFSGNIPVPPSDVQPEMLRSFFAYDPRFTGGVTVGAGDTNLDGRDDVITGTGAGGVPLVRVWDAVTGRDVVNFYAYQASFTGGVFVSAIKGGGFGTQILTAPGAGGPATVKSWHYLGLGEMAEVTAYDPAFRGGATVSAVDLDGDGVEEIVTGAGPGGGPHAKAFDLGLANGGSGSVAQRLSFFGFDPAFTGGVFVG